MFHLLPFLEEISLYQNSALSQVGTGVLYDSLQMNVGGRTVQLYNCPSDPSVPVGDISQVGGDQGWADTSYAYNFQIFGIVNAAGVNVTPWNPNAYTPPVWQGTIFQGGGGSWQGAPKIPGSIPDGTSKTIMMGEHFATCGVDRAWNWDNDRNDDWGTGFGIAYYDMLHGSMYNEVEYSSLNNIGVLSKFQQMPLPYQSTACVPSLTQSPHPAGMNVLLADGHVRILAPSISGATWWVVCTPAHRDLLGEDWNTTGL
jgi:prepilin-type processing-associated H-X9-DG protein